MNILDTLVAEIRRVPLSALPQIVGAIRAARSRRTIGATADEIAEMVLALPGSDKLREVERAVALIAVEKCDGNVSAAARMLGVDRKVMERRYRNARRGGR